ncbi:MAG: TRAP transporter substrate-binding protein [Succinivibrionaceae bacterium]|nr:TRAP transporter substrate-binding protein [Succinivibrionaceae bacterium]
MKIRKTVIAAAIASLAMAATFSSAAEARELRLGHAMPVDNAQNIGLQAFADEVKKLSKGELTVTIYPNGELGSEREMAEQVVTGALDMTKISGMLSETFEPRYGIMSIPYLFHDYDHLKAFVRSDIPEKYFFQQSKDRGLIGLFMIAAGTRDFYTTKPVKTPDDIKGMKMRVPESDMAMRMITAMGGQPTPVPWTEVYSALQQKVVDGAENNISGWVEFRHMEVCPYLTLDDHTMTPDVIFISDMTWESLSDDEKKWLKAASKVGIEREIEAWDKKDAENLQKAKDAGKTFIEVDKQLFRDKTAGIIDEERKKEGYSEIIDAILALAKK